MHGAEKYEYSVSFSSPMADDVKNLTRSRFVYHRRRLDRVHLIMPSVALTNRWFDANRHVTSCWLVLVRWHNWNPVLTFVLILLRLFTSQFRKDDNCTFQISFINCRINGYRFYRALFRMRSVAVAGYWGDRRLQLVQCSVSSRSELVNRLFVRPNSDCSSSVDSRALIPLQSIPDNLYSPCPYTSW